MHVKSLAVLIGKVIVLLPHAVKEVDELQRHSALSIFSTQDTAATKQQFKR